MPHVFFEYEHAGHIVRADRTDGTAEVRDLDGVILHRCDDEATARLIAERVHGRGVAFPSALSHGAAVRREADRLSRITHHNAQEATA